MECRWFGPMRNHTQRRGSIDPVFSRALAAGWPKLLAFFRGLNHPPIPVFRLSGVATYQVDGVLTKRATRVSLTFRRVRDPSVTCTCDFEKSCDRDTPVATATFLKKEADVGVGATSK